MPILPLAARRRGLIAAGLAAGAAALAPSVAAADAANSRSVADVTAAAWAAGRAEHGADVTARQALAAYWTPARMRAARPAEAPSAAGEPTVAAAAATHATARRRAATRRKPFSVAPVRGRKVGRDLTRSLYNPNLNYWTPTAYTNGKVFFTLNGVNKVCSAAIVNSEGADTVWTAGHCVHGGGTLGWATNWVFVPAYDDDLGANPAPYGIWSAAYLVTRTAWIQSAYAGEDMGVAIMNTNLGGWHIVNYFGGHGFRANLSKYQHVYAFGYPSSAPYDGGNLWGCSSDVMPTWDYGSISSDRLRSGCDFTYGASGGPWLLYYNGSWGYLNGVTSAGYPNVYTNSPYFGANAQSLYDSTRYL